MHQFFGYLSAITVIASFIPYIASMLRRKAKPERASWFIWTMLGSIAFFSQLAKGATNSLWLPAMQTLGDAMIFILSIKFGMGGWHPRDKIAFSAVLAGLALWYFTKNAASALFAVIAIDASGGILTIIKSNEHPATEPFSAWLLTCLAGLAGIFAVQNLNWILLAFPIYTFVMNAIIIAIIFWQRETAPARA